MDSRQAVVATSGALENLSAYLNGTLLASFVQDSNEYISTTLGIPPGVVYSGLAALVALPLTMSRYGWSSRDPVSPYASTSGAPKVREEDYDYITSQDLEDANLSAPIDGKRRSRYEDHEPSADDDVLLIKNRGVTYPAHFPAYAIGDGKLQVDDVRQRVGLMMDLSERTVRRIKLLYKGKQLKDATAPVRDYGVKNKSELMAVVPEGDGESASEEEMVVVSDDKADGKSKRKRKKRASKKKDKNSAGEGDSSNDSSGALKMLDELSSEFATKWLPLCVKFTASPPADEKKRDDEHRKLSESVLQHVLLRLDGVETEGKPEIRARRKELVGRVQDVLKELDRAKTRV